MWETCSEIRLARGGGCRQTLGGCEVRGKSQRNQFHRNACHSAGAAAPFLLDR